MILRRQLPNFRFLKIFIFVMAVLAANLVVAGRQIRVATLNLDNYLMTDRRVEERYRPDYPKPEAKKKALREVILATDADILAVQEIGVEAFLLELQRDLRLEGLDYPHTALMEGGDPDRHTAVLSKVPFREVFRETELEFKYFDGREPVKRGLLEVVFETGGLRWSLFNLHLKSRRETRPDDPESNLRRRGEALAVREFIRKKYPPQEERYFLVVGDLNGSRNSPAVRFLLRRGKTILAREIAAYDSRGEVWTYFWAKEEEYSRVDYILASPSLYPLVADGRGVVVDLPQMGNASDHRMVYADLDFPD